MFLTPAFVAGLVVVGSLRLWGENFWYRLYVHQILKTRYNPRSVPFVRKGSVLPLDIHVKARALTSQCCTLRTSKLNDAYRAFNSNRTGGAIYWNQLRPLARSDPYLRECIRDVQRFAHDFAEHEVGAKLHAFDFSMWNVFVLKYSGVKGSFDWHYDSESPDDYRVLICVDRTPTCGHVEFRNARGGTETIELAEGQCYVLRGSTTFHRVTANGSEEDERVMLGFHFSRRPGQTTKNLCYFATLTGWKVGPALRIFATQYRY